MVADLQPRQGEPDRTMTRMLDDQISRGEVKETPPDLMIDTDTVLDYETCHRHRRWTGVRPRDLLQPAGIIPRARDVMPEGLDAVPGRRPASSRVPVM
jgi:DMSO/TMAO reductase YedYZ molybdopterin-dependent catalytic subunit